MVGISRKMPTIHKCLDFVDQGDLERSGGSWNLSFTPVMLRSNV